jgi:hypothetical protein
VLNEEDHSRRMAEQTDKIFPAGAQRNSGLDKLG